MAGFMVLGKFRAGLPDLTNVTDNLREMKAAAEQMGGRVIGIWGLMGRFDLVAMLDAPDEMTAAAIAQVIARRMSVSTETQRAFSEEELAAAATRLSR